MRHAKDGDRVHPDDHQWKSPAPITAQIDHRVKRSQQQKAPACAEDGPARRPDSFYNRTDSREMKSRSRCEANQSRLAEQQSFFRIGAFEPKPPSGDEAKDHRAKRRDKA